MKLITTIEVIVALIGTTLAFFGLWDEHRLLAIAAFFLTLFIMLIVMRVCSWFISVEQDLILLREVLTRLNTRPQ